MVVVALRVTIPQVLVAPVEAQEVTAVVVEAAVRARALVAQQVSEPLVLS